MEHQTLGRRVVCPFGPANQRIILQVDGFFYVLYTLCIRETCCLFVKTWLYIGRMNVMLSSLFFNKKVYAIAGINAWQHPIKLPSVLYFFCFGESLVYCRYYIRVIKPQSQSRAYLITKGAALRQGSYSVARAGILAWVRYTIVSTLPHQGRRWLSKFGGNQPIG